MARLQATGFAARAEHRARVRVRSRRRRLGLAVLAVVIALPVLVLAFDSAEPAHPVPLPQAKRLLPSPPEPRVVALEGSLSLMLPIEESRVTAVGYHALGAGALALEPVGTQANAGLFTRLVRRLLGQEQAGIQYYLLGGGPGSETAALDVGAPVGTDVYAPVDGTVIGISDYVVSGESFGNRIDLQPSGSPGLVVSLVKLEADSALTVGSVVAAARTKIGTVVDLSSVETSALARHTQDSGQHVELAVRPAANLTVP